MRVSIDNLVAPGQVGWVFVPLGQVEIAVKVVKNQETGKLYASLPTAYKQGQSLQVIRFKDKEQWIATAKEAVQEFMKHDRNK